MRSFFVGGLVAFGLVVGVAACGKEPTCAGCVNAAGACEGGTSSLACGSLGLACSACGSNQACLAGACVTQGGGGGNGATGGGSGATGGGTGEVSYMPGPDGGQVVSIAAGDPCAAMPALVAELVEHLGECPEEGSGMGPLTEERCRSRLPSCTSADRQQIDVVLNCFRRIPACTQATRFSTWSQRERVCEMLVQGIARPCQDALSH